MEGSSLSAGTLGAQIDQPGPAVDTLSSAEAGARFIRGGAYRSATTVLALLMSLVSVPLMIRHLGPVGYGYFATASAIVFIIAGVTEAGLSALGVREYATGSDASRRRMLRNLVGLRLTATAAGIAVAAGGTALLGSPSEVSEGVLFAGVGLMITLMAESYAIPLSVELRLGWSSALDLLRAATLSATYVTLVVIGSRVVPFLGATVLSGAVMLFAVAILVRREVSVVPAFDFSVWRKLLVQTLPFAMAAAVGVVYFREAVILMSYLSTSKETGYYGAAFRIVEVLATVPWMLVATGFPIFARAARDDPARMRYALQRLFEVGLILGVWMSASTAVGAPFGIRVVAGPGFGPAVGVLRIQGVAVLTAFLVATFGFALLAERLHRQLLWANAAAVSVCTLLALLLIPRLGARGAAIAPTAAEACLAIGYAVFLIRARPQLRVSLWIVPRIALALAVALGAVYLAPISVLARLFLLAAVYFLALAALRAIPFELWNALLRRRPHAPDG